MLADLIRSVERAFGCRVAQAEPIRRGWLNLKWKLTTESGPLLLKQYNKRRYRMYREETLLRAFRQQVRLYGLGLACPRLLAAGEDILLHSEGGERFLVMEHCAGELVPAGRADERQMYALGREAGRMHRWLNDGTVGRLDAPQFVPPGREERLAYWRTLQDQNRSDGGERLLADLELQLRATEAMSTEDMAGLLPGWAHRDLWADNLLFDGERVAAILDFDRLNYDYPDLDIARAVLSYALDEAGVLHVPLAAAFVHGYREERELEPGRLTRSFRVLWYMESVWWIRPGEDPSSSPPIRFAREMRWLAAHQEELSDLLGGL